MKTTLFRSALFVIVAATMMACSSGHEHSHATAETSKQTITVEEVNTALKGWTDALVEIGKVYENGGDYAALAQQVLDQAYGYKTGKVFFKPTLANGEQTFRPTNEGALAYFVGGNANFPNDKGFAITPWVAARYDALGEGNEGIQIHGDVAIFMGNVWVKGKDGNEVMVDKTFAFKKGEDGKLRIILHHSSLPYQPVM